jgi:hypothetical protein
MAAVVPLAASGCAATSAEVAALERTLASGPSATAAMERWCAVKGFAAEPRIAARRIVGAAPPEPAGLRAKLGVSADETLGYRHVELVCGDRVLSVAHNWYPRSRLTPAMNAALDGSDAPFGKVAAPLNFTRETIDAIRGGEPGCPAGAVLSQIALLRLPDGAPLAFLIECYTPAALR